MDYNVYYTIKERGGQRGFLKQRKRQFSLKKKVECQLGCRDPLRIDNSLMSVEPGEIWPMNHFWQRVLERRPARPNCRRGQTPSPSTDLQSRRIFDCTRRKYAILDPKTRENMTCRDYRTKYFYLSCVWRFCPSTS